MDSYLSILWGEENGCGKELFSAGQSALAGIARR